MLSFSVQGCLLTWMIEARNILQVLRTSELIPSKVRNGSRYSGLDLLRASPSPYQQLLQPGAMLSVCDHVTEGKSVEVGGGEQKRPTPNISVREVLT